MKQISEMSRIEIAICFLIATIIVATTLYGCTNNVTPTPTTSPVVTPAPSPLATPSAEQVERLVACYDPDQTDDELTACIIDALIPED